MIRFHCLGASIFDIYVPNLSQDSQLQLYFCPFRIYYHRPINSQIHQFLQEKYLHCLYRICALQIFHSCQHTATVLVLLQIKTCILSLPYSPFFHLTSKTLFRNLSEAGSLRQNIQVSSTFSFQSCKDLYTNQSLIRSICISFY